MEKQKEDKFVYAFLLMKNRPFLAWNAGDLWYHV